MHVHATMALCTKCVRTHANVSTDALPMRSWVHGRVQLCAASLHSPLDPALAVLE